MEIQEYRKTTLSSLNSKFQREQKLYADPTQKEFKYTVANTMCSFDPLSTQFAAVAK